MFEWNLGNGTFLSGVYLAYRRYVGEARICPTFVKFKVAEEDGFRRRRIFEFPFNRRGHELRTDHVELIGKDFYAHCSVQITKVIRL